MKKRFYTFACRYFAVRRSVACMDGHSVWHFVCVRSLSFRFHVTAQQQHMMDGGRSGQLNISCAHCSCVCVALRSSIRPLKSSISNSLSQIFFSTFPFKATEFANEQNTMPTVHIVLLDRQCNHILTQNRVQKTLARIDLTIIFEPAYANRFAARVFAHKFSLMGKYQVQIN